MITYVEKTRFPCFHRQDHKSNNYSSKNKMPEHKKIHIQHTKKNIKCFSLFNNKTVYQSAARKTYIQDYMYNPFSFSLLFTAALSKAIFLPLLCSSAFVNISAKGIRPQLYFPFPQRLTTQSPETLLSDCLIPSQHSRKASLFLLYSFALFLTTQTALLSDVRH